MEVEGLKEAEEVGEKGPEVPILLSQEEEDQENLIKIVNFGAKVIKPKRKVTKFQIKT